MHASFIFYVVVLARHEQLAEEPAALYEAVPPNSVITSQ